MTVQALPTISNAASFVFDVASTSAKLFVTTAYATAYLAYAFFMMPNGVPSGLRAAVATSLVGGAIGILSSNYLESSPSVQASSRGVWATRALRIVSIAAVAIPILAGVLFALGISVIALTYTPR